MSTFHISRPRCWLLICGSWALHVSPSPARGRGWGLVGLGLPGWENLVSTMDWWLNTFPICAISLHQRFLKLIPNWDSYNVFVFPCGQPMCCPMLRHKHLRTTSLEECGTLWFLACYKGSLFIMYCPTDCRNFATSYCLFTAVVLDYKGL